MDPPRLPWEVIERVINHSAGRPKTLQSLALTCRQLRPRSRIVMFARVQFKDRDNVFAFVDFLQDNPHLPMPICAHSPMPVVRSIIVRPVDFAPFPLLHILPNLSEIEFSPYPQVYSPWTREVFPYLHQSSLTSFHLFGTHIKILHLFDLSFATSLAFVQVLLAFPSITDLVCISKNLYTPVVLCSLYSMCCTVATPPSV
ncbi:hypothetical protein LXA43DRAFT_956510 [Ganoderma leucocontextum]|nr:hypothetical protein LXA43DRAFT_956510 [Ganoderma leucocontextum]